MKGAVSAAARWCWRGLLLGVGLPAYAAAPESAAPATQTPLAATQTPAPAARAAGADPIALTQSTRPASPTALAEIQKETPRSRIRLREGGVRVWSRAVAGEPKSDLLAVRTDEKGRPAGAPIVLHRTSGTVLALLVTQSAVTVEEPTIWVGWMTYVAGDASASRIVAALRITAALDKVSRPVTVHHGRAPGYMDGDINPDLLVGSGSPSGGLTLSYALDGVDLSHGKRHVDHVAPEGIVRALGIIGPAGGDGGDGGLLDIGSGVLAWSMAYKGGPNWVNKFFPYVPGTPASKLKLIECSHLPLLRYFNGREVITHCPTDSFSEEEPCFLKTKELPGWVGPFCARVLVQRLDGTVLTPVRKGSAPEPVPLTADREICVGGSWRRELAWQGGSVRLEQDVPGAPPPRQPCTAGTRRPYKESD